MPTGLRGSGGASAGESEVKFAISESSRPGPSAQFPVLLDAAARVVTERASPGEIREVAACHGSGQSEGVCTEKRECAPGRSIFPCARHKNLLSGSWRLVVTGLRSACRARAGYGGSTGAVSF